MDHRGCDAGVSSDPIDLPDPPVSVGTGTGVYVYLVSGFVLVSGLSLG